MFTPSYLFGHFDFDQILILFRSHGIHCIRRFEHVDEQFVGQNIELLLVVTRGVR